MKLPPKSALFGKLGALVLLFGSDVHAQIIPSASVTQTGPHTYEIENITFDSKTREIRLPVEMNLRDGGPLEFLLVHETGKVHESLLKTSVTPTTLEIAMKLLRYRAGSGDVLAPMLPPEDRAIAESKAAERGEIVNFFIEWEGQTTPIEDWVIDHETRSPIDSDEADWIYTGSYFSRAGSYMAQVEGSLIAIYLSVAAQFNTPLAGSDSDERWSANGAVTPELETELTLLIQPAQKNLPDE